MPGLVKALFEAMPTTTRTEPNCQSDTLHVNKKKQLVDRLLPITHVIPSLRVGY